MQYYGLISQQLIPTKQRSTEPGAIYHFLANTSHTATYSLASHVESLLYCDELERVLPERDMRITYRDIVNSTSDMLVAL